MLPELFLSVSAIDTSRLSAILRAPSTCGVFGSTYLFPDPRRILNRTPRRDLLIEPAVCCGARRGGLRTRKTPPSQVALPGLRPGSRSLAESMPRPSASRSPPIASRAHVAGVPVAYTCMLVDARGRQVLPQTCYYRHQMPPSRCGSSTWHPERMLRILALGDGRTGIGPNASALVANQVAASAWGGRIVMHSGRAECASFSYRRPHRHRSGVPHGPFVHRLGELRGSSSA